MANLGEIAAAYRAIADAIEANGGELSDEQAATFDKHQDTLDNKVDACRLILRDLQGEAAKYKRESEELGDIGRAYQASADRLEDWIKTNMRAAGVVVAGKRIPLRLVRNSQPSYKWTSDATIPVPLQRLTVELDTKAVARLVKSGLPLPSGVSSNWGYHIRPAGLPKANAKAKTDESRPEE